MKGWGWVEGDGGYTRLVLIHLSFFWDQSCWHQNGISSGESKMSKKSGESQVTRIRIHFQSLFQIEDGNRKVMNILFFFDWGHWIGGLLMFDYMTLWLGMMATLDFRLGMRRGMRPVVNCNNFSVYLSTVLFCWTTHQFFMPSFGWEMNHQWLIYSIEEAANSNNSCSPKGSKSRFSKMTNWTPKQFGHWNLQWYFPLLWSWTYFSNGDLWALEDDESVTTVNCKRFHLCVCNVQ